MAVPLEVPVLSYGIVVIKVAIVGDLRELLTDPSYELPPADVVIGGFPCQDFSKAGSRRGLSTARGRLYESFVEAVRRIQPRVFVAENVPGLLTINGALDRIKKDFAAVGYQVNHQLIKCEEHGVPQRYVHPTCIHSSTLTYFTASFLFLHSSIPPFPPS